MSKILITADLHIHPHSKDLRRLEDGIECLKWIYNTAKENSCKSLIIAGDLFHDRNYIHTLAFFQTCKIISENQDIKTYLLLGNHDMYREHTWLCPNSLESLKKIAEVIDSPKSIKIDGLDIDFLPYTPTPSKYLSFFKPNKLLISHLGLSEAIINAVYDIKSVEDDSGEKEHIDSKSFSQWDKVFLGHYHFPQKIGKNVEYIGSPMALTYGEANQNKHVIIFNTENFEQKYITNEISPKFIILEKSSDLEKLNVRNAFVKIKSTDEVGNAQHFEITKKAREELGVRDIQIMNVRKDITKATDTALEKIDSLFLNKEQLIEHYVNQSQENLDKEKLKKIGMQILCDSKE